MQVDSGLSPLSTCKLYGCLRRVTIPEAVVIQFVLLRYSMQVESGLSPLSTCILYSCLQRVTIPEAVVIRVQFVLLRMSSVLLEMLRIVM